VVGRLGSLSEAIEGAAAPAVVVVGDGDRVAYEGLTLRTPKGDRVLLRGLTLEIPRGRRLLLYGPNTAGKGALIRATLGIWEQGEGHVVHPPRDQLVLLPERPHAWPGTLRDQLLPPGRRHEFPDDRLAAALGAVRLEDVLERVGGLDAEHDWPHVLSPGEQQLLAVARLLLAEPHFAILDDAVKALDGPRAREVYQLLSRTPITYISVAEHPTMREYHEMMLELHEDGSWELQPARRAGATRPAGEPERIMY
jgi:putative ATP-binding cassette transporter